MRYAILKVRYNADRPQHLFSAKGLQDSAILHLILCELNVEEYEVIFTNKRPAVNRFRSWYFGTPEQNHGMPDFSTSN